MFIGCLYPTAEHAKAGCIAGSVIGGHTVHVPGMSEFMCEICANDQVASHSVVSGPTLASTFYKIIKWVYF